MLHPQAQSLLTLIEERGIPPTHTLTPPDARSLYHERRGFTQPAPPSVGEVRELSADGPHGSIPLRLYRPLKRVESNGAKLPVLVYYHGGGWVIGDLDTHDTLCRELANASGCAVVAVDYRKAPEHGCASGVDDCVSALRWLRRESSALGLDADRLAVGGESAGGNRAAVVALSARDAGDPPIRFQLLIYPATDMRRGAPSHTTNGAGYLLTRDTVTYFHDHYIDDLEHDHDWRASPLLHTDLANLPPALVLTAGYDPLRDAGHQYAVALTQAGNRATYVCFERQIHGFITMGRVLDEANAAVSMCAAELRRALTSTDRP